MLPTFHDGHLTGLAVSDREATLSISRSDGVMWRIELAGVRYLKADDFREGNIIFAVEAMTGVEPPRDMVEALVSGPHEAAAQEHHDKHRAYIDGLVEQVATGSLTLLSLSSSYGCELRAVCEAVTAREVG
jgi:hypothetical protein